MSHTRLPLPLGDTLTLNPLEKEQGPGDRGYSGPFVGGAEGWGACRRPWGGLSFLAEAHEEDGEGAAGGAGGSLEAAALSGVKRVRDVGPCMISRCYKPCCWVSWYAGH